MKDAVNCNSREILMVLITCAQQAHSQAATALQVRRPDGKRDRILKMFCIYLL